MDDKQKKEIENLLRSNLLMSTGCTEPIAIAYASAIARKYLDMEPTHLTLKISKNMAKNAMDAGIPNSKYVGAAFVSALGALFANPDDGFQLLENLTEEQHNIAYKFSKENVDIEIADIDKALYIEVEVDGILARVYNTERCCTRKAKVIVADGHTKIHSIEINGVTIFNASVTTNENNETISEETTFSMKEVFEYAESIEDLSQFEYAVKLNKKLGDEGKKSNWGLNVGKVKPFGEDTILSRVVSAATSGVDARMAGAPFPAMACTGSGNQGITTTMPVYQFATECGASYEKTFRAIAISILTAIYVKKNLNVLSHLCGAVIASCGASAGIAYLLGGDYQVAEFAVKNVLASVTGMFCDGAKSTCAMKVLSCVTMAVYAATMAVNGDVIKSKVGIACPTLLDTIKNVAKIETETAKITDKTIMDIIVG